MEFEFVDVTVVPAQPGYKLFGDVEDEAKEMPDLKTIPHSWMQDIVAWRVETVRRDNGMLLSLVEPLAADGCKNDKYYILRPDGVVEESLGDNYENTAALLNHLRGKSNGNA